MFFMHWVPQSNSSKQKSLKMSKKFEKIKNYNQLLLAIAGTLTLLFFIGMGVIFMVDEFSYRFSDNDYHEGILSSEETEVLLADTLRKQIISFPNMFLVDSISKTYLLPVSQADLHDLESTNDLLGLINSYGSRGKYYGGRSLIT